LINNMNKFKILLTVLLIGSNGYAIGTAFLTMPTNPREMALGGMTVSISGDALLSTGNPALLASGVNGMRMSFGYGSWFSDMKGMNFLLTHPGFGGTIGWRLRQQKIVDLEYRSTTPTDDALGEFSASGTSLEVSWGGGRDRLRMGGTLRFIYLETYTYSSSGVAADLGGWFSLINDRLYFGLSLLNVGAMNAFNRVIPDLPTSFSAGVTVKTTEIKNDYVGSIISWINLGVENSSFHGNVIRLSGEIEAGSFRWTVGTRISEEVSSVSTGIEFSWRRFELSYGLEVGSHQLGIPHLLNLSVVFP